MEHDYPSPLDQFLTLGEPSFGYQDWRDYPAEFGLAQEQAPALIRMATDRALLDAGLESVEPDSEPGPEELAVYAPIHAWRALGELRAVEALDPLLTVFDDYANDDWVGEDLPRVLGMLGPAAIPPLEARLRDPTRDIFVRMMACDGLQAVAQFHPAAAGRCVAILHRHLQQFGAQDRVLNGNLIAALVELNAAGALPTIAAAFQANAVDLTFIAWDDVIDQFGDTARRLWPDYEELLATAEEWLEEMEVGNDK